VEPLKGTLLAAAASTNQHELTYSALGCLFGRTNKR